MLPFCRRVGEKKQHFKCGWGGGGGGGGWGVLKEASV